MKFNHLNVPEHWQHYWSRYPEGYTILEALISWVSQVDDMIDNQNQLNETVKTYGNRLDEFIGKFDTQLQETVEQTLSDWQTSGFLDVVINEALDTKYHEMDTRLTSQLAQKADKVYTDAKIDAMASGTPKIIVQSYVDLPPIGGLEKLALVLDDGHKYYDDGVSWKDAGTYEAVELSEFDKERLRKTQALHRSSVNLFDKEKAIVGYYTTSTGDFVYDEKYRTSALTPIKPNTLYTHNGIPTGFKTFWDINENFISGNIETRTFTTPTNARYVRVTIATTSLGDINQQLDSAMIVEGSSLPTTYIPYDFYAFNSQHIDTTFLENIDQLLTGFEEIQDDLMKTTVIKRNPINLFNKQDIEVGYYAMGSGVFYEDERYRTSGLIPIEPQTVYSQTGRFSGGKTFWDASGEFISGTQSDAPFSTPINAAYIRVTVASSNIGDINQQLDSYMLVEGNNLPNNYIPFYYYELDNNYISLPKSTSRWNGKKWNVMGDSITHGYGSVGNKAYHDFIAYEKGIIVNDYGVTASGIAIIPERTDEMSTRYEDMDDDADLITVFGGTNDHANNVPLGSKTDTTNETFYGALKILVVGLINKYPDKTIVFFTPLHKSSGNDVTLEQYSDAIKDICNDYSIPVFDARAVVGIQPLVAVQKDLYMPDGLHPNLLGQERLADKLSLFLETV